ncbi:MAG: hypothetical protein ACLFSE_12005, partial [Spirochaetia bacterium]
VSTNLIINRVSRMARQFITMVRISRLTWFASGWTRATRRRFLSRVELAVCETLVWMRWLFTPPHILDWRIPKYIYD